MDNVHIVLGAPKEEAIKPLMKEQGIVIGVDRGALLAIDEKIEVDIALGDFDSISDVEKTIIHSQVEKVLDFPTDKDDTDTELAFLYVLENYPDSKIYVYNWYGGRIDHLYSILLIALQERFESLVPHLQFVSAKNHVSFYSPGEYEILKQELMDYLSFILLTEVDDLTLSNVKYTLDEQSFNRPLALISNEFLDTQANFSFSDGMVAVVQSTD